MFFLRITKKKAMTKEDVLKQCTVEGNVVKLPQGQLDKKLYGEVKKALEKIGGSWKGGKVFGFIFSSDPSELLSEIAGGVKRNIKKEFQFYATPTHLSKRLVELACLEDGDVILEPSAGQGSILDVVKALGLNVKIDCCELMPENKKVLEDKGYEVQWGDFLALNEDWKYTKIIANPPFAKNQDIKHVRKMYNHLEDTGKVVAIMSTSWIQSSLKEAKAFKAWLDDDGYFTDDRNAPMQKQWHIFGNIGESAQFTRKNGDTVYIETLDSTHFKESGANVKTCIVVIDRYTGI